MYFVTCLFSPFSYARVVFSYFCSACDCCVSVFILLIRTKKGTYQVHYHQVFYTTFGLYLCRHVPGVPTETARHHILYCTSDNDVQHNNKFSHIIIDQSKHIPVPGTRYRVYFICWIYRVRINSWRRRSPVYQRRESEPPSSAVRLKLRPRRTTPCIVPRHAKRLAYDNSTYI